MNIKILLSIIVVFLSISNGVNATNTNRLIIGTGSNIKQVMENEGAHSQSLIEPTPSDITIDTDPKVIPTIVGNMGDYKIYENILRKEMQEKGIKEFDEIIFEHTPAVEGPYVVQSIDKKEWLPFKPNIFSKRENKAGKNLDEYFKAFNGSYYSIIVSNLLKKGGTLTILSRRYNYEPLEVWAEWCKGIKPIAELENWQNKRELNEEAVRRCNNTPQQTVEDYYKNVLKDKYDDIKIGLVEDKSYIETPLNSGVRTNFKYIKITATKK